MESKSRYRWLRVAFAASLFVACSRDSATGPRLTPDAHATLVPPDLVIAGKVGCEAVGGGLTGTWQDDYCEISGTGELTAAGQTVTIAEYTMTSPGAHVTNNGTLLIDSPYGIGFGTWYNFNATFVNNGTVTALPGGYDAAWDAWGSTTQNFGTFTIGSGRTHTEFSNAQFHNHGVYNHGGWLGIVTGSVFVNHCGSTFTPAGGVLTSNSDAPIDEAPCVDPNEAPVVNAITLPADPIAVNVPALVSAAFTDANTTDTHTGTINWGPASAAGTVSESSGTGTLSGSFAYAEPGVYAIDVTLSDGALTGDRSSLLDTPSYIVVYDPSAGFVTGGGWINSPLGACTWTGCAPDGSTIGKANFGFVSRYKKGAQIPDGNTEFRFGAGGLAFTSTSYQWLVVAGPHARFSGTGQIAGDPRTFRFMITAIDGAVSGSGDPDQLRIRIWDAATGDVVYDNRRGEPEQGTTGTALGGGSIVIHQ